MKVNGGEANDTPNGVRTSEPLQWNECKLNKVKLNEWNERGRLAAITTSNGLSECSANGMNDTCNEPNEC